MRAYHLYCTLVVTALACIAGCSAEGNSASSKRKPEPVPVVSALVQERDFVVTIESLGTARSRESVLITSRVDGRISEVFFTEGTTVRSGDPLVRLEDDSERAELRSATAVAEQARSRNRRLSELSNSGLIPRDDFERQRQLLQEAEARLDLAQVMLDQRTIRAPFAGTLGFRDVSPGTLVQPGSGIVTIDALDAMRVMFSIPETQIAGLRTDNPVEATTAAWRDRRFNGQVSAIGTRVDEVTRAIPVQALIDNDQKLLKPGMLMTLRMQTAPRTLRYVPESALAPENGRQFVWVLRQDSTVEKRLVETGVRKTGWVEITDGVTTGDRVIAEGISSLRPGRTVREVPSQRAAGLTSTRRD
jgi:membrane fusion protein (multidrug efflux system)